MRKQSLASKPAGVGGAVHEGGINGKSYQSKSNDRENMAGGAVHTCLPADYYASKNDGTGQGCFCTDEYPVSENGSAGRNY